MRVDKQEFASEISLKVHHNRRPFFYMIIDRNWVHFANFAQNFSLISLDKLLENPE